MPTGPSDLLRISLFFPVYRDERTTALMITKAVTFLESVGDEFEVIVVDDASPDRSGAIADEMAAQYPCVRVIHHPRNLGYGAAVRTGLQASRFPFVCFTDGDDQYEIEDFRKLIRLREHYDLIITFRYKKIYSSARIFISWVYNSLLRFMFRTRFRDVSTGLRMVRRPLVDLLPLESASPFIGAELAIKAMFAGYRVGEVGIQTFPRSFGQGSSTSTANIAATIVDMWRTYRTMFSDEYDLPLNRQRPR